ncbi:MAG TPA: efflux RND transporter periplasmic adaptor subunit [Bryobacteraceae bacterium]|nr:efflux RND transporter periplasmic adaptor subunit [Bryobacteraceae bacterium]
MSSVDPQPETPRKRRWVIWTAALLILTGGGSYLLSQRSSTDAGPAKGAKPRGRNARGGGGAIPVSIEKVRQGNMGVYISALGTVTPVYTAIITSRVAGQLMEVHYREGQLVHKGDLLAVIDPRPYQAAYTQAQGQLQRDQALLSNAKIDLERYRSALAQHAIPEQTMATQQAAVNQYEGTAKLDEGNADAAKVNLDYSRITAPIDGRVGLRSLDPGNIVQANGTAPLLTITQLQPITVIFTMAEDYIYDVVTQLRAGHKLQVDAYDRDNQTHLAQGMLLTLDNQIDTATGTVRVRASFANGDSRLFPNEFVNARLLVKTLMGANIIPTAAIQRNNEVSFVYVVDPAKSTVLARNIKVVTTDGLAAAVTGVAPDETVVTDGFDRLQDNVKVVARSAKGPAANPAGNP